MRTTPPPILKIPEVDGGLWIWKWPEPYKLYAIGVDTSSGVRDSDPSAAQVIEFESCEQVAEWSTRVDPNRWGRMVARLGWLYNEAEVGIETHPSPHGLACYDAAATYGYANLFQQQKEESRDSIISNRKGFFSSGTGREHLINRVRQALSEGAIVRSDRLLSELLSAVYSDDEDRLAKACRNDLIVAWGLSLRVRDAAYRQGIVPTAPPERLAEHEKFWQEWEKDRETPAKDRHGIKWFNGVG